MSLPVSSGLPAPGSSREGAGVVQQAAPGRPRLVFFHSKFDGRSEGYIAQVLQRRQNHEER
jgi:hypothetical protein